MAIIFPEWPAPANVRAFYTTRSEGQSGASYASLNLADHVGDHIADVSSNRKQLIEVLEQQAKHPLSVNWLVQVHGTHVKNLSCNTDNFSEADASLSSDPFQVCVVLTADCLPILLCDKAGTQVAAVHAGWRGLAAGIIGATVAQFNAKPSQLICFLGPAISQPAFEVGEEVKQAFLSAKNQRVFAEHPAASFKPTECEGKYTADLYRLARAELQGLGVSDIYGGDHCSFSEAEHFYSYRRDRQTGRMATGIWLQ